MYRLFTPAIDPLLKAAIPPKMEIGATGENGNELLATCCRSNAVNEGASRNLPVSDDAV